MTISVAGITGITNYESIVFNLKLEKVMHSVSRNTIKVPTKEKEKTAENQKIAKSYQKTRIANDKSTDLFGTAFWNSFFVVVFSLFCGHINGVSRKNVYFCLSLSLKTIDMEFVIHVIDVIEMGTGIRGKYLPTAPE